MIDLTKPAEISDVSDVQTILAGGSDPTRFDSKEAWYPVYYLGDLDRSKLATFTLLGQDLVIWWDRNAQTWRAFVDRCPHRLARLSEGRIAEDGLLECPYHGWAFTGEGDCDRIPQQPADSKAQTSARACADALPTAECQGLLFVYAGQPENAAKVKVPAIEALEESPKEWTLIDTFRDLPYDALTLLENVLDSSHLPFTHHRSVGNRANAAPVDLELVTSDKQGFVGAWEEGPRRGKLGRQDTVFVAPNLMWHDLTSKQFGRTMTVVYATPTSKGACRLFARFPFKFSSKIPKFFIEITPRWVSHISQNGILEDDQIFLHHQERYLESIGGSNNFAKAFYLPTKADLFVTELRKWVNQFEADPFPDEILPPAMPKHVLLDRYYSHTVNCKSCRDALRNLQRIRASVAAIGSISWAVATLSPFILSQISIWIVSVAVASALSAGLAWVALGRLERRFYDGQSIPLRNVSGK